MQLTVTSINDGEGVKFVWRHVLCDVMFYVPHEAVDQLRILGSIGQKGEEREDSIISQIMLCNLWMTLPPPKPKWAFYIGLKKLSRNQLATDTRLLIFSHCVVFVF